MSFLSFLSTTPLTFPLFVLPHKSRVNPPRASAPCVCVDHRLRVENRGVK